MSSNYLNHEDAARLHGIIKNGTEEEKQAAKAEFLKLIDPLIKYVLNQYYESYWKHPDYRDELLQEARLLVLTSISFYDPTYAPATFFARKVREAANEFISKYIRHSSRYYSDIATKIRAQMNIAEMEGHTATPTEIAAAIGYPEATVRATLDAMNMEQAMVDINEALGVSSKTPTPEEAYLIAEQSTELFQAICGLPEIERDIFCKFNGVELDHETESIYLSEEYKAVELAKKASKTTSWVYGILNSAKRSLRDDLRIKDLKLRKNRYDIEKNSVNINIFNVEALNVTMQDMSQIIPKDCPDK